MSDDSDYMMPESDDVIRRVIEIIDGSPSMPMSSSVRVNKEEILEMLEDALARMPEELRQAKWLLKDREAFLAERHREGEAIVARAAETAARLVDKREIVKNAQAKAEQIVEDAEKTSRRRRREADDYCDQQLARYENALVKLHKQVGKMRDRLAAPSLEESELGEAAAAQRPRQAAGPRTGQTRAVQARGGQRTGQTRAVQSRPTQRRPEGAQGGEDVARAPQRATERPDSGPRARNGPGAFDQDG